jgi:hypothetical protein
LNDQAGKGHAEDGCDVDERPLGLRRSLRREAWGLVREHTLELTLREALLFLEAVS